MLALSALVSKVAGAAKNRRPNVLSNVVTHTLRRVPTHIGERSVVAHIEHLDPVTARMVERLVASRMGERLVASRMGERSVAVRIEHPVAARIGGQAAGGPAKRRAMARMGERNRNQRKATVRG
jgi:hypothetical protein